MSTTHAYCKKTKDAIVRPASVRRSTVLITVCALLLLMGQVAQAVIDVTDYLAYYNFNDNISDQSYHAYDLTFVAGQTSPYNSESVQGKSLSLVGNGNNMVGSRIVDMPLVQQATNALTISYWAYLYNLSSASDAGTVTLGYTVGNREVSFIARNSIRKQWLRTYDPSDTLQESGIITANAVSGTWFQVVGVYDLANNTQKIYNASITLDHITNGAINGISISNPLKTLTSGSGYVFNGTNFEFVVGRNVSAIWTGYMDELAIWNRALSEDEIQGLFAAGKAGLTVASVPEPTSALLVGSALALLLRRFRRR